MKNGLNVSRRAFLGAGGCAAGGLVAGWFGAGLVAYMGATPETPWKSLTPDEAAVVDRLAEELVPADDVPGAHAARVVRFIDWQLAPHAPYARDLALYREHVPLVRNMPAAEVEKRYPKFFATLLTHVMQGFFGHPIHGGNADWIGYRIVGLPGPFVTGRNVPGKANLP